MRQNGQPSRHRAVWTVAAVGLAAAGIAVSVAGERLQRPWLTEALGPALTLLGAAVWVGYRALRRRPP